MTRLHQWTYPENIFKYIDAPYIHIYIYTHNIYIFRRNVLKDTIIRLNINIYVYIYMYILDKRWPDHKIGKLLWKWLKTDIHKYMRTYTDKHIYVHIIIVGSKPRLIEWTVREHLHESFVKRKRKIILRL